MTPQSSAHRHQNDDPAVRLPVRAACLLCLPEARTAKDFFPRKNAAYTHHLHWGNLIPGPLSAVESFFSQSQPHTHVLLRCTIIKKIMVDNISQRDEPAECFPGWQFAKLKAAAPNDERLLI